MESEKLHLTGVDALLLKTNLKGYLKLNQRKTRKSRENTLRLFKCLCVVVTILEQWKSFS